MTSLSIALMLAHYADLHPDTAYTPDPRQCVIRFPHPHTEPGRNETGGGARA